MCWMKSSLPNQFAKSNVTAGVILAAPEYSGSNYIGGVAEFTVALAEARKKVPPPPPPPR